MAQKLKGQQEDANGKCQCERCGKRISQINFYTYKDGSKCEICKPCLTAHIDNFDPNTFEWILEKMDVPYIPTEWNVLRDKKEKAEADERARYVAELKVKLS